MLTLIIILTVCGFMIFGVSFISRINSAVNTIKDTAQTVKETSDAVAKAKEDVKTTFDPNKPPPGGVVDETPNSGPDGSPVNSDQPATVEGFEDGTTVNTVTGTIPPAGAPINAFFELGDMSGGYPEDIWLDNVALTIPPSNVGTTDIIFVDAGRPQQCYQKCKSSPFCRFFSYWHETGSCNLHQTLQNGETTPENVLRYAYTVPFSQHWTSGYVRKSGGPVPEESRL